MATTSNKPVPASSSNKVIQYTPNTQMFTGDIILNPLDNNNGYHVVIQNHVSGAVPPVVGASNDLYHYSLGASKAGQ